MRLQSLALALAAFGLAAPAAAAEKTTIGVRYADLDLTSEAGQRQLKLRLESAAREVCGLNRTLVGWRLVPAASRDCYREARRQLNRQFALLASRHGFGG